jgi:hypothetical protein
MRSSFTSGFVGNGENDSDLLVRSGMFTPGRHDVGSIILLGRMDESSHGSEALQTGLIERSRRMEQNMLVGNFVIFCLEIGG